MSDFGAKLREARKRRGVSLREIAELTKISVAALESLERNDPSRLPKGIFTRAIVRSYAEQVGLDPEATVREFVTRFDVEPPLSIASAEPFSDRTSGRGPRLAGLFLKIFVASLVAVAIILYLTRARHAAEESTGGFPDPGRRTSRRGAAVTPFAAPRV